MKMLGTNDDARGADELSPLFDALRELDPPPHVLTDLLARAQHVRAARSVSWQRFALRAAAASIGFVGVSALARFADPADAVHESAPLALLARVGRALHPEAELATLPEREFLGRFSSGKVTR